MFRVLFLLALFLTDLECSASCGNYINASEFRNLRPVIFSHLDKKDIKSARLVCKTWDKDIKQKTFDLNNPHLLLPETVMNILFTVFTITDPNHLEMDVIVKRYQFYGQLFYKLLKQEKPEFDLKIRILLCPIKDLRAKGYKFIFKNYPYYESALLFASYVSSENRDREHSDILMNYLNGITQSSQFHSNILSARGDVIKFNPQLLTLVEDKKYPENSRHPLEIEALKALEEHKATAYRKKLKEKCCQIHKQAQKIAQYISWLAVVVLIFRVTIGF